MTKNTILVATMAIATIGTTTQSCMAIATSSIGLTVLKQILLGGITKGLNIFSNQDSFLANQLIDAALPQQLRDINNTLQKLGLNNLVQKEKQYIAQAAAFTVDTSRPILVNAVNSLTAEDAARIVQGGSGAATQILKERTSAQLMAAIAPKVDAKLNEFGLVQSLNSALAGTNILGSIFGGQNSNNLATSGISNFAAQQMVNGLFNIIESHEQQNATTILNSLNGVR
ncbi:DUF4197 domain-containing protein [Kaistella flava (ex Peng et al. 2021)]|uniref:DUF4197 domain-containing protein n=1 Tax=Kaistella flava (ex Peng et al. 2021) TaxID=2038776 RepID=A0A7M2Y501_9FLAO|nr:DUF4197 family protein [Kaistella flava (ex Peng et al. 2021)]QOW09251.1 DUF4197 domain-containing protein [Kaistella flava (ex Peng et al. 2021)]